MTVPRRIECLVSDVVDHGEKVYTVRLTPRHPAPSFHPGQFLHLALDDFDPSGFWPESRVFSIAGSPLERDALTICYAVKGVYTSRMAAELAPGRKVWVKLPYGDFTVGGTDSVVLLAGGTGMTAFTAFLAGLVSDESRDVTLVYGARLPSLLVFHDMVKSIAARLESFRVLFLVEDPGDDARFAGASLDRNGSVLYGRGRISVERLAPLVHRPELSVYYLSGPPAMIKDLSRDLQSGGVPAERIRVDAWE